MLTVLHLLAAFVLFNHYMIVPVVIVRVPRLLFRLLSRCCERKQGNRMKLNCCGKQLLFLEQWFRLLSGAFMIVASFVIQYTFIFEEFCPRYREESERKQCY